MHDRPPMPGMNEAAHPQATGQPSVGEEALSPRPAATVVVVRDTPSGPEVLVLLRAAASRFGPGYVVFPGGVVEPGDANLALRWFGDEAEVFRACTVRELAEETAVAVGAGGLRTAPSHREALQSMDADPPDAGSLREIAHWIAPVFLPRRFDARFFAVRSGSGVEPLPDGEEIERAWWSRPGDVLDRFGLWTELMWPTFRMLQHLAGCRRAADVLALRVPQEAPPEELERLRSPEWGGG